MNKKHKGVPLSLSIINSTVVDNDLYKYPLITTTVTRYCHRINWSGENQIARVTFAESKSFEDLHFTEKNKLLPVC